MTTDGVPSMLAGRYLVGAELGSGGAAVVLRAWDTVLRREVAVKVLRRVLLDPAARERFAQEAQILARLDHPGLVPVYDADLHEDHPFLVMELVDGHSLAGRRHLPPAEVRRIGAEVAAVLAHVHGRGITHRDVKPGNILRAADGRVKLADFGIARVLGSDHATATGVIVGTAAYLAPEQVRGEPAGGAADVYALGLVLLELLRGEPVYQGAPDVVALARLTTPPAVDPAWPPVLAAMTDLDPLRRPSAAEVARRLSGHDDTVVLPHPTPHPVPHPARRGRRVGALVAAAVLLPGLALGLTLRPEHSPSTGAPALPSASPSTTRSPTPSSTSSTSSAPAPVSGPGRGAVPVVRDVAPTPGDDSPKGGPGKGNGQGDGPGNGKGNQGKGKGNGGPAKP